MGFRVLGFLGFRGLGLRVRGMAGSLAPGLRHQQTRLMSDQHENPKTLKP